MKKKSTTQLPPSKTPKNENKQSLKCLIKNLRPKVYITDSSNFKNLVQELTGNGNPSPVPSPPTSSIPLSPPTLDHARVYQENSVESSCFSTPFEGYSPHLRVHELSHDDHCLLFEDSFGSQNQGFPSLYADLETLLMEMDSISSYDYDGSWCDHGRMINQQEVCVYDYDLSTMI